MSQSPYHTPAYDPQKMPLSSAESNSLGTAGFVVSLLGLVLCGIPSIIGLIISAVALRKNPKGLAIAGVAIGLLGLLELAAVGFAAFTVYRVAETTSQTLVSIGTEAQTHLVSEQVAKKWEETGELPSQAEGDEIAKKVTDLHGNRMVYETDGVSFSIRSRGPDGELNTDDDIVSGPFLKPEDITEFDPEQELESDIEDLFNLNKATDQDDSD